MKFDTSYTILQKHFEYQSAHNKDAISQNWYKLKLRHSKMVFETMQELLDTETEFNFPALIKEKLLTAALLHDVGRFYQMENGELKKIKHGGLSKKYLETDIPDLFTLLLIQHHDDKNFELLLNNPQTKQLSQEETNVLEESWLALRDCDMLANAKMMKEDNDIYAVRNPKDTAAFEPIINEEMFNAVISGRAYNGSGFLITIYDSLAGRFCWLYQYHFKHSINVHIQKGITDFLIGHVENLKQKSREHGFQNFSKLEKQMLEIKQALQTRNEVAQNQF